MPENLTIKSEGKVDLYKHKDIDSHTAGGLLKLFLRELPVPIVIPRFVFTKKQISNKMKYKKRKKKNKKIKKNAGSMDLTLIYVQILQHIFESVRYVMFFMH